MSNADEFLAQVDEWKKECCDSTLSDDVLVPVLSRSFDVMSTVLKDSDRSIIQKGLRSLEFERSQSLEFEKITEPSLLYLVYGHFECLHKTIVHLIEGKRTAPSEEFLSTVEDWKRKCCEISIRSDDVLVPVLSRSFDVMSTVLKDSDQSLIQRALGSLEYERSQSFELEKITEPSFLSLIYGHFECLHKTFVHLIERKSQSSSSEEIRTQTDENSLLNDTEENRLNETLNNEIGSSMDFLDDAKEFKEEIPEEREDRIDPMENEMIENVEDKEKDSSEVGEMEKRRPTRRSSEPVKFMDDSDEGEEPAAKKSKSTKKKCDISNFTVVRKKDGPIDVKTTPKCVLCEVYPKTAFGYAHHLNSYHQSTLKENGIFLLCSCGWGVGSKTSTQNYNKECDGRDFTLHKVDES